VVCSLDVLPTSLAAVGIPSPKNKPLDGVNLLGVLSGQTPALPRDLFWCSGSEEGWWAVRSGDWKLVAQRDTVELFDLAKDVSETNDLSMSMPDKLSELTRRHDEWLAGMAEPVKAGDKKWIAGVHDTSKKKKPTPEQRKKARDAAREANRAADAN
jgi:arylsulfatase A-like enzyme